jgi:hypothetical protein
MTLPLTPEQKALLERESLRNWRPPEGGRSAAVLDAEDLLADAIRAALVELDMRRAQLVECIGNPYSSDPAKMSHAETILRLSSELDRVQKRAELAERRLAIAVAALVGACRAGLAIEAER